VRLTGFVPQTPTLMGALNRAALNLANALGAEGGAVTIGADWGPLSTVWAGLVLTVAGLVLYAVAVPRSPRPQESLAGVAAAAPAAD
jgi:MFS transporter, DHA1 family, inner membrane transport protein